MLAVWRLLSRRVAPLRFAAVVVLLAGCSTPPPDIVKPEATAPAVATADAACAASVVRTNWTFTSGA